MKTIGYKLERPVPVIAETDVLVVGAGPGGIAAAVTAARNGAKTVLVERYGFPGGMAAAAEVSPFMFNHAFDESLDKPFYMEWRREMAKYHDGELDNRIDKYAALLAAEDLLLSAGVQIFYHLTLFDVMKEEKIVNYAIFSGKDGLQAVSAKIFIDSTGDGDLAYFAGNEYWLGNEEGLCQPMSLCFKMSNVDTEAMPETAEINRLFRQARAEGRLNNPRENLIMRQHYDKGVVHFNSIRVLKLEATKSLDLSEAEIEGRRQMRELWQFFRREVRGFEHAAIHSMGTQIGIRETRRIVGRAYLDTGAFLEKKKFPGAIARVNYMIDVHDPAGSGTKIIAMPKDEFFEIPYLCLVARDLDNLLIGCRAISVSHELHSCTRIMPLACSCGQAAGMAAAMALKSGLLPHEIPGESLRAKLVESGANL